VAHVSKRAEELDPRTEIRTQKRNVEEKTAGTHSRMKKAAREPVLARVADRENQWRLRQMNPPARWLAARTKKLDLAKPGQNEKSKFEHSPCGLLTSRRDRLGNTKSTKPKQLAHTRCKPSLKSKHNYNRLTEFTALSPSFDWKLQIIFGSLLL
jgi:hypothetical protein